MTQSQAAPFQRSRLVPTILLAATCLLIAGAVFFYLQVPDLSRQLPPNAVPILVTLSAPTSGELVGLNFFTIIEAQALGIKPIISMELWIDGTPMQAGTPIAGSNSNLYRASWVWTPDREGNHTLLIRAKDADQHVGTSNIVRVTVSKQANQGFEIDYQPQPEETVDSIAENLEIRSEEILELNPQITPDQPLDPSQTLTIPIEFPELNINPGAPLVSGQPPSGPSQPASPPSSPFQFWLSKNFSPIQPELPAAPNLYVNPGDCAAEISIGSQSENEDGFFLYRLAPNSSVFKRIQTFGPADGAAQVTYEDAGLSGNFEYYVSAFSTAGESPSNIVSVEVSGTACPAARWSTLQLENPTLITSLPVDKSYCYASGSGGPWARVPSAPNAYLFPEGGQFDLSQELNALGSPIEGLSPSIEMECWGWQGDTLTFLGRGRQDYDSDAQTPSELQLAGDHFQVTSQVASRTEPIYSKAPPSLVISPPSNFHTTQDPAECNSHSGIPVFGPLICAALIDQHEELVFVWDWPSNSCPAGQECAFVNNIDGYRIYGFPAEYPGGAPIELMATVSSQEQTVTGFSFTTLVIQVESGIFIPGLEDEYAVYEFCYYATAFLDGNESAPSETICPDVPQELNFFPTTTPVVPAAQTLVIPGDNLSTWEGTHYDLNGNTLCPFSHHNGIWGTLAGDAIPDGTVSVGYLHKRSGTVCDKLISVFFRGQIGDFSILSLKGKTVERATLSYSLLNTAAGDIEEETFDKNQSCAAALMLYEVSAGDEWLGVVPPLQTLSSAPDPQTNIDITQLIAEKVAEGNDTDAFESVRFILTSNSEALPNDDNLCISNYGNFELIVSYH